MKPTVYIVYEHYYDSSYEQCCTEMKGIFKDKSRAEKCAELLKKENKFMRDMLKQMGESGFVDGYYNRDDIHDSLYSVEEETICDYWMEDEDVEQKA